MRLTPERVLQAYARGLFPMAESRDAPDIVWIDPLRRGILPLERFHISHSLARQMRRGGYQVTLDRDFAAVIDACADRPETWINPTIRLLYLTLHARGEAHSLEVWADGRLIGGSYGVTLGAAWFGESMFSRAPNGSKLALAHLTDHLSRRGYRLFDTQFLTPHLASLGAIEISRTDYHRRLAQALSLSADFGDERCLAPPYEVLQRNSQMS